MVLAIHNIIAFLTKVELTLVDNQMLLLALKDNGVNQHISQLLKI
jgi:hypothetical protein